MKERIVLCEGYHDRAFWQGALETLNCIDPGEDPSGNRKPVLDPRSNRVAGGQYAYYTPSKAFVRVLPCKGKEKTLPELKRKLNDLTTTTIDLLVVNWDDDGDARRPASTGAFPHSVLQAVLANDPQAQPIPGGRSLNNGATRVLVTSWRASDPHSIALPWKQTLERLVTSAIDAAYPGRGHAVGTWLAGMPATDGHKAHAWSHMAGWFSEQGGEAFYRQVWKDPLIRSALELGLQTCGAWAAMKEVAQ